MTDLTGGSPPYDQNDGVVFPTVTLEAVESRSDRFFKWGVGVTVAAIAVIVVANLFIARSSSADSQQASIDAAAARAAAEAARASLEAQQLVVDRSGCLTEVYSRFYLSIAEVIIQEDPDAPSMERSREELRGLIDGSICPIPNLSEEITPPSTVPSGGS